MPNWVFNKVTISSQSKDEIDLIVQELKSDDSDLSFENIIPCTDEATDDFEALLWSIDNWGTKWDASNAVGTRISPKIIQYNFETPWSPPMPVLQALAVKYENAGISLEFEEEQGFGAVVQFQKDSVKIIEEWAIPVSHAELIQRGKVCSCDHNDEQSYDDCFMYRTHMVFPDNIPLQEAVAVLGPSWVDTFDDLISTCFKLI